MYLDVIWILQRQWENREVALTEENRPDPGLLLKNYSTRRRKRETDKGEN